MNNTNTTKHKSSMPVLALRDQVMLPNVFLSLTIGREISINSIMKSMDENNNQIILVSQKDMNIENPSAEQDLYNIGTLCNIRQVTEIVGNAYKVYIEGVTRVKITSWNEENNIIICDFQELATQITDDMQINAHTKTVISSFSEYIKLKGYAQDTFAYINKVNNQEVVANLIANNIQMSQESKQEFLEELNLIKQLESLLAKIDYENAILTIEKQLKTKSSEAQKERLLEQINTIQHKLIGGMSDTDDFMKRKQEKGPFSNEILEREYQKAFNTLRQTSRYSAEYDTLRGYIDVLLSLPTQKASINNNVEEVLKKFSEKISGQEKIKELIAEQISVMARNRRLSNENAQNSRIICFTGNPGVGKTSMAKAITYALTDNNDRAGKKLQMVNIALGGLHDESALKGHRRTYVSAMCGQIITGFIRTGITNPVFLLDEIDKIGGRDRGNPEGILLSLLDPSQNHEFFDNYINAPYDVSNALFIATANDPSNIHPALRDRLHMIEIPPYNKEEKLVIAKRQMWPMIAKNTAIQDQVTISDNAIRKVIGEYTSESGVRYLYKLLDKLAAIVVKMYEMNQISDQVYKITTTKVSKLLGPKLVLAQEFKDCTPGVVNGLSVSMLGGSTLIVESAVYDGDGKLEITGMAEKVMLESVKIALTNVKCIASNMKLYDKHQKLIDKSFFEQHNFHIHFNEGAVPKDGPSAGITSLVSLLSAITGIAPKYRVAMTGELTLTGSVSGVGGIVQKLMAAYIGRCKCAFIPLSNIQDLKTIQQKTMHPLTKELVEVLEKNNYDMYHNNVIEYMSQYKKDALSILKQYAHNNKQSINNDGDTLSEPENEDELNRNQIISCESDHEDEIITSNSSHKSSDQSEQYEGLMIIPLSSAHEVIHFVLDFKIN